MIAVTAHPPTFRIARAARALSLLVAGLLGADAIAAPTPAGTVVRNQASASYRDADGVERFATSNVVETTIRQRAALTLVQDQDRLAASGLDVVFPHVLTNTGNGVDTFELRALNRTGDAYDFERIELFADVDQDGVADDGVPLSSTPALAAGEAFRFVVVARVPDNVPPGQRAALRVRGRSVFDAASLAVAVDRATVTAGALIEVVKSTSALEGASPGGPHTVTLAYRNAGSAAATDVVLIDRLPAGMSYVPGSGRWSGTGATVLSDAGAADVQGGGASGTIRYCAYGTDCAGLPAATGAVDGRDQVTAVLSGVPPGAIGTLAFDVSIDAGVAAGTLPNTAEFEYDDAGATSARLATNTSAFRVTQAVAVVANGSLASGVDGTDEPLSIPNAYQGSRLLYDNVVWNNGNGVDSLDVLVDVAASTFPEGTVYRLFRADGRTPLLDSDGDGAPDTGPLEPGEGRRVVLGVVLPPDALGDGDGAGFEARVVARSSVDPSRSNPVLDRLGEILPSAVDLTADAPVGEGGALGTGAGAEPDAVVSRDARPGGTVRYALHVNNVGDVADGFALAASTDPGFADLALPEGWSVTFRTADDDVRVSTGTIAPAGSVRVFADVRVPPGQGPIVRSLYFRVLSETTGALDVLHAEVAVGNTAALVLEPSATGQVSPGGTIVHAHRLANEGNATLGGIALATTDSLAGAGWASTLHADTDGDGTFGAGDVEIDSLASLAPGEAVVLFVRVLAPANASPTARNTTTLAATPDAGEAVSITDLTTVGPGGIGIVKLQAPDLGCDGTLDGPFALTPFSIEPGGNCVRYRLIATNGGSEPIFNAVVEDATPAFTVYVPAASCSVPGCTIVEPAAGGTGLVSGAVARVPPGGSVELTFAVAID